MKKTRQTDGNKIQKGLKYTRRFTWPLNLDTVLMMSKTNIDCATSFSACGKNQFQSILKSHLKSQYRFMFSPLSIF